MSTQYNMYMHACHERSYVLNAGFFVGRRKTGYYAPAGRRYAAP